MRSFVFLAGMALAAGASADIVVPNAFASTEAPSQFFLTSTATAGRTYQMTIAASQLTGVVGHFLTGMTFRLGNNTTAAWPPGATSFSSWDIRIGAGVSPAAMSSTFASNFTAGNTLVRSGGLLFAANAFPIGGSGTTPNAFGPVIGFTTNYAYFGGDLTVEMRFSGQVGATNQPQFDGVAATDTANGWGTLFSGRWTSSMVGTTGGNANFLVTQFTSTPVPEPASMVALGLGVAALMRRRKKA